MTTMKTILETDSSARTVDVQVVPAGADVQITERVDRAPVALITHYNGTSTDPLGLHPDWGENAPDPAGWIRELTEMVAGAGCGRIGDRLPCGTRAGDRMYASQVLAQSQERRDILAQENSYRRSVFGMETWLYAGFGLTDDPTKPDWNNGWFSEDTDFPNITSGHDVDRIMACYESVPDAYYDVLAIDAIYDQTRRRHFDYGTSIDWNQLISRRIGDLGMVVSESFDLQVVPHGDPYSGIDAKYEIRKETCDLIPQIAHARYWTRYGSYVGSKPAFVMISNNWAAWRDAASDEERIELVGTEIIDKGAIPVLLVNRVGNEDMLRGIVQRYLAGPYAS